MALAWVICHICKTRMNFGEERWKKNKPVCDGCHSALRGVPAKDGKTKRNRGRSSTEIDPEELGL